MTTVHRFRWQFGIKSMLAFVFVFSLLLGLTVPKMRRTYAQHAAVERLRASHASVLYDFEAISDFNVVRKDILPPEPQWAISLLGIDFFHDIVSANVGSDDDLQQIASLQRLKSLSITELPMGSMQVTNNGLQYISQLKEIKALNLSRVGIDDRGMRYLKAITTVEELDLSHADITSAGLKCLDSMKSLHVLRLDDSKITDETIREISALQSITELGLSRAHVTENCLVSIAALQRLEVLILPGTNVGKRLCDLRSVPTLRELYLGATDVNDSEALDLGLLVQITVLELGDTTITDSGLRLLLNNKNLKKLRLFRDHITSSGFASLTNRSELEDIDLSCTEVDDTVVEYLSRLKHLRRLNVEGSRVSAAVMQSFKSRFPRCEIGPFVVTPVTGPVDTESNPFGP